MVIEQAQFYLFQIEQAQFSQLFYSKRTAKIKDYKWRFVLNLQFALVL